MIDRRLIENIDWALISLLLLNSLLGVLMIYSSSHYLPGQYYVRQLFWIGVGLAALFVVLLVDYKMLVTYAFYFYGLIILVLLAMLVFGQFIKKGSWIQLPFFQVQPSELAKIALILALAHLFSEYKKNYVSRSAALASIGLAAFPSLLVALQPDLGTALSYLPLLLGSLILAGLRRKVLAGMVVLALLAGVAGWNFYLKDYQKKRLATVVFPGKDPQGSGYHILQSKIAIGSGGLLGRGFKKGTQSQLKFLPARHTDFIFSVIGEEFGFAGASVILFIYSIFLLRLFRSAGKSRDRTGVYIVFMVSLMFAFQLVVNVAMVIGIFPIIGIPLPLLSYGGSSLLANFLGLGLVLNVKMRRFVNI
jgi:rod shape determining protein RodA